MSAYCISLDCNTSPSHNYKNETKRLYCKEHKLDGMVDVKSKKCLEPDCNTRPVYNYKNETKGL